MTDPTATPWWTLRAQWRGPLASRDFDIWAQTDDQRYIIGRMFGLVSPNAIATAEENATRVITAVQSHHALVKVVEAAAPILAKFAHASRSENPKFAAGVDKIGDQCSAALRLARGERS